MAEVIRMPKLSDTMEEGVIAAWHKKVGDKVEAGDLLAEIETDKATMEFESFQEGTLLYRGLEEGEGAAVDTILAILGEKGEDVDGILKEEKKAPAAEKTSQEKQEEKPAEEPQKEEPPAEKQAAASQATPPPEKEQKAAPVPSASSTTSGGRVKASPLARRMAEERNIPIQAVQGSGFNGRIVRRDIENFRGGGMASIQEERYSDEPVSQMRKTIAKRLSESKFSAPHFYLTLDIDMGQAMEVRKAVNKEIEPQKISFNDLVIKAAAQALKKHPKVNASFLGDKIRYYEHVHVGVAVAVEEGLLVPVVRFADGKPLTQISTEVRGYADKAHNKQLQPEDWEGNTFTISNLGMYGIEEFTAIINPPDACILAVGGIKEKPVVKDGQIVPGNIMKVTLSCDHRVVDGATGSAFLQTFKNYMENPVLFLGTGAI